MTGKKLLEKGELQRRYTIIPLNKISAKTLNDKVISTAKRLVRKWFIYVTAFQSNVNHCFLVADFYGFCLFCEVGEDNVHTALSLVGYESDLRKAMEYVFGSTLVCDTLDNAKKVAFDKQVMTKTVTLGGDIFDPQGTLSGGEINTRLPISLSNNISFNTHHSIPSLFFQVLAHNQHRFCQACRK